MSYKLGSLFDGSGGFPLSGTLCDIEPMWAAEVEPYPIAVTSSRFPNMKHLGDISKVNGAEIEPVAPGTVFYRNELGGFVCTSAFHQDVPYAQYHEARNRWYLDIFDKLNGKMLPVVCTEQQEIMTMTRDFADGNKLLYITNLNFDDLESIRLRFADTPSAVCRLTPEGTWEKTPFTVSGHEVTLQYSMACYDAAVFKIEY